MYQSRIVVNDAADCKHNRLKTSGQIRASQVHSVISRSVVAGQAICEVTGCFRACVVFRSRAVKIKVMAWCLISSIGGNWD